MANQGKCYYSEYLVIYHNLFSKNMVDQLDIHWHWYIISILGWEIVVVKRFGR